MKWLLVFMTLMLIHGDADAQRHPSSKKLGDNSQRAVKHESSTHANKPIDLLVDAGNSTVLTHPGVKRIAVGNSQVIKAKSISTSELLIFGLSSGSTSLEVWNKHGARISYRVDVVPAGLKKRYQEVSDMLVKVPNAKPSVVGNQVVIEGENLSESDRLKIRSILKRYPDVMDLTSQVGWDSMVLLDVQVLELPTTRMRELGVRWDPATRGGIHAGLAWEGQRNAVAGNLDRGLEMLNEGGRLGTVLGLNTLLTSRLHALTQSGEAVVLAQPQLLTRSGTTASFLAGGELPYSSIDKEGKSTTTFRKYGVSLNITPEVDRTDVVRSKIEIEVSSVDASVTAPGGPALKIRKATSDFNVMSGQTLVIGGFISRERHADRQGLPGLSEIPVAGYVFGSQREQSRETELAIFVTPVVLDASHPSIMSRVSAGKEIVERAFPDRALMNHDIQTFRPDQQSDADVLFSSQWSSAAND